MYNVEIAEQHANSQIEDVIFDACRANEKRIEKNVRGFNVQFAPLDWKETEHRVTVRDEEGVIIAFATVDKFDC